MRIGRTEINNTLMGFGQINCTLLWTTAYLSYIKWKFTICTRVQINKYHMQFQERASAVAENRPLPSLYSSTDVRPLKMDDFKYAHEQVPYLVLMIMFLGFSTTICYLSRSQKFNFSSLFAWISSAEICIFNFIVFDWFCNNSGLCKRVIRVYKYEWASSMEWVIWRRWIKKEKTS